MGGSGKWVKSLIGLKKPEKEDCKVRERGCSSFLEEKCFDFCFFFGCTSPGQISIGTLCFE